MCLSYEVDTGGIDKSHDKRERAREEGGGGDALTEPPAPELKKKSPGSIVTVKWFPI